MVDSALREEYLYEQDDRFSACRHLYDVTNYELYPMMAMLIVSMLARSFTYQVYLISALIPIAIYLIFIGEWFRNKQLQILGRFINLLASVIQVGYVLGYYGTQ